MSEEKVKLLERILKWMTGAREIRYMAERKIRPFTWDWGYIELVDVRPEDIKIHGFDDGLHIDWDSEIYTDKILKEEFKDVAFIPPNVDENWNSSRIICDIWYGMDPYARIEELESKIKEYEDKVE